jgi:hypothetical protein
MSGIPPNYQGAAKVPKTTDKTEIKIDIRSGKGTDYQRALWHKLFSRLTTECQRELKAESEAKK